MDKTLSTAHHEAAHAVVQYRTSGFAGGPVTIKADQEAQTVGACSDYVSDSTSKEHARCRILSAYAGACSDRILDDYDPQACEVDEEIAAELLRDWRIEAYEAELRMEAERLVNVHWREIGAVARELVERETLTDTEVEMISDIAAGVEGVSDADLVAFRALLGGKSGGTKEKPLS